MVRDKIKELRQLRKLSQAGLGKLAGLTAAEISRIELGYRDLNASETDALARALGVLPMILSGKPAAAPQPVGLAAARQIAARESGDAPSAPEVKVGTDLDDPTNFTEQPDLAALERGDADSAAYRARLLALLERTQKVLHTSRVPAATWRAWRAFERPLQDKLRTA